MTSASAQSPRRETTQSKSRRCQFCLNLFPRFLNSGHKIPEDHRIRNVPACSKPTLWGLNTSVQTSHLAPLLKRAKSHEASRVLSIEMEWRIYSQQFFGEFMVCFVKIRLLKVAETLSWALPFCLAVYISDIKNRDSMSGKRNKYVTRWPFYPLHFEPNNMAASWGSSSSNSKQTRTNNLLLDKYYINTYATILLSLQMAVNISTLSPFSDQLNVRFTSPWRDQEKSAHCIKRALFFPPTQSRALLLPALQSSSSFPILMWSAFFSSE